MTENGASTVGRLEASAEASPSDLPRYDSSLSEAEIRIRELSQEVYALSNGAEFFQEQIAELELAIDDEGWMRMSPGGDREFSSLGLRRLRRQARLSFLKNPLIRNGVNVQANYVWGQGCSITAGSEEVNTVIQRFLDDPKNTKVFTGHTARLDVERDQQCSGNAFLVLFTNRLTGRVVVRIIEPDEVEDIIRNPNDSQEPWYYKRTFSQVEFDASIGETGSRETTCYYPDWRLVYSRDSEVQKVDEINGYPVKWDSPVYHVKTGGFSNMRFGIPEIYSALDWARAVKSDLEDYATQKRALARFAWKMSTKGGKAGVATARKKLGSTLSATGAGNYETNPPAVAGSTFIGAEGMAMDPIKMAGATISPEEGHRLWLMVAAGHGLPETILAGNADSGNLATAKTLDRPTELKMMNRQKFWADIFIDILGYAIDQAALAGNGLSGNYVVDEGGTEARVELGDELDRSIDVQFPSILQRDDLQRVQAVVQASTLGNATGGSAGVIDDRTISQLLLNALGEDDIDEKLEELYPDSELTFVAGKPDQTKVQAAQPIAEPDEKEEGPDATVPSSGEDDIGIAPIEIPELEDLKVIAALRDFKESMRRGGTLREATPPSSNPGVVTQSGFVLRVRR